MTNTLSSLSDHELVGRLIWVGLRGAEPGEPQLEAELERCKQACVGGVILFDVDVPERNRQLGLGLDEERARLASPRNIIDPEQAKRLVGYLKEELGEHLIVCIDQEGGQVCRLNPARGFASSPAPRDYAEMSDGERFEAAHVLARTIAGIGVDLNLGPCVDVAINPDGPGHTALGRSFGRDPDRVIKCAREQIDALHAHGVGCSLKHFPGHGSASGDTHFGLVDITETFVEPDELAPYRALCAQHGDEGPRADSVMISHLVHRGYDPELPASVSRPTITGLLRDSIGFDGVVLTDALDMHAIADRFGMGEAAVRAIEAGADCALEANNLTHTYPCPAPEIHAALTRAVNDGRLTAARLAESVARLDRLRSRLQRFAAEGASHA